MGSRRRRVTEERLAIQPGYEKEHDMKTAFATAALILATAGSAAFAQGMEGQRIGCNDQTNDGVSYSSRSEAVDESKLENFKSGNLRAEDLSQKQQKQKKTKRKDH